MTEQNLEKELKETVRQKIFQLADSNDWMHLNIEEKKELYESWSADPDLGGQLITIMPLNTVRVYIKDTVMKKYSNSKRPDILQIVKALALPAEEVNKTFIKPVAIICNEENLYTLAIAKEWRVALLSAFERRYENPAITRNMIFVTEHTQGRFIDQAYRSLIETAAKYLSIEVHWVT